MEIIKPKKDLIIDENYKPKLSDNYIAYFNKALVFAQTNYQEQLDALVKNNIQTIAPSTFLKEYAWSVYCSGMNVKTVSSFFPKLLNAISPFYEFFRNPNAPINAGEIREQILMICPNQKKADAIIKTAYIINNGIKLLSWEDYRKNFLSDIDKLIALPYMGDTNVRHLARNIGLIDDIGGIHLHRLCARWGFNSSQELCLDLQKKFLLRLSIIELILWYSTMTFGTKLPE
jgi:hypothetical protein